MLPIHVYTNLNQRLIKTPKIYLEDTGLAIRLQGWSEFEPLLLSPYFGSLLENLVLSKMTRFFINRGMQPQIYFVRSKEKIEIDFWFNSRTNVLLLWRSKRPPGI